MGSTYMYFFLLGATFVGSDLRTLHLNSGHKYFLLCSLVKAVQCFILHLDLSSIFGQFLMKCENYVEVCLSVCELI